MCNEGNEPKGSLSNPRLCVTPNAQQRAQHVKGVGQVKCKATGKTQRFSCQARKTEAAARRRQYVEERGRRCNAA